jgi:enoyl-CoA hydratase/carnithine racemase
VADTILYEQDEHIVTITYHRPERMNAINGQMRTELNAAWLRFRDDVDAWVAILTGTGRAFCAGADVREGNSSSRRSPPSMDRASATG